MSEKIAKILNYVIGLIPIGALFGLMAFVAKIEIKDLDLWLHLGVGKYITLSGTVPQTDIFSISAAGNFWNNHEWLFQTLLYQIFFSKGVQGLAMMQIVVVSVTLLCLLFIGYSRERQFFTTINLLLVYMVYQTRFTIRPDLFSLLFFAVYIYILSLHIDKRWSLWVLIIVQILWTNMHGFFFFGPLFALIGLLSEWIKRHAPLPFEWNQVGRLEDDEYGRLGKVFFFSCLACTVNPQFINGAIYPIVVFFSLTGEDKIFFKYIQELQKPVDWATFFSGGPYAFYKMLIIISTVTFLLNRRKIDLSALFLWIIFLFFSLNAIRNITFFAFAAYLVIITNCYYLTASEVIPIKFRSKKFVYITGIFFKILLTIWIFSYCKQMAVRGYYDFDKYERKSEFGGVAQRDYPNKAADFIIENNIKGNFFNDFNSGSYLIGRTYPNIKVFIDGRTELYGGAFFKKYLDIWEKGDGKLFDEMVEKYNLTGAFLNSTREQIPRDILRYLNEQEDWVPIYLNYDAIIFLKDIPENQVYIDKFKIDLAQWEPPTKHDLFRLGSVRVQPYHYTARAFSLESMDYDDQAMKEAMEALKITPDYADAHELIGKVYTKRKEFYKAFLEFRHATLVEPHNKKNRYNLALSYMDMYEYDGAVRQYKSIHEVWPNDPKAVFFLSKAYAFNRQYDKAFDTLKKAATMSPQSVGDVLIIADVVYEDKKYELAMQMYQMALDKDKDQAKVHHKLGLCYQSLQKVGKAKEHLAKALELEPDNEEFQQAADNLK